MEIFALKNPPVVSDYIVEDMKCRSALRATRIAPGRITYFIWIMRNIKVASNAYLCFWESKIRSVTVNPNDHIVSTESDADIYIGICIVLELLTFFCVSSWFYFSSGDLIQG